MKAKKSQNISQELIRLISNFVEYIINENCNAQYRLV
jgi:hypothetical protein